VTLGPAQQDAALGPLLDRLVARYGGQEHLESDPLQMVYRYGDTADREIVAFIAAALSFGNVKAILGGIEAALSPLGEHPAQSLAALGEAQARGWSEGFRYRWIGPEDIAALYLCLGRALCDAGGLEPLFASGMTREASNTLGGAETLISGLRGRVPGGAESRRGVRFLLADPGGAGASKRVHMFLRWMIRAEAPDLGIWTSATPAQLVMPLDTHVGRIARYVGLTGRVPIDRRTALEVTEGLRAFAPEDPTRYDFAMARLGILGHCPHRRDVIQCANCDLVKVCRL
jgi:uncharacterized protein (TIGR02757 family)